MKISTRIALGYLAPCIAFTIGAAAVYHTASELRQTIRESQRMARITEHGLGLQVHVAELQREARGALLNPKTARPEAYAEVRKKAEEDLQALRTLVQDRAQVSTLDRMSETLNRIAEVTRRQVTRVAAGDGEGAVRDFAAEQASGLYASYEQLSETFVDREKQLAEELRRRVAADVTALITFVAASLAAALLSSLILGAWLVRSTVGHIRGLMDAVASSSAQIAATTVEHEGAMAQQAGAVTETTATVEEMVATARVNAEQAQSANESANAVQSSTRGGLDVVERNARDLSVMSDTMNRIAQQIVDLSQQAGRIGDIARVVGELSAETNMLALNAAVEAARAGEQGKGFAVVAAEVRKLADQSKKSAEMANQIVIEIQKGTSGIAMAAEDGSKRSRAAADGAHEATVALGRVIEFAETVCRNAQQVLLNSKQQAVALAQIDIAMKNINRGAHEMSTGTAQVRDGVAKLASVASELKKVL